MEDLEAVLGTVRNRIARYRGQGIGEQDTKAGLIVPLLRALGWDTEDLEDVKLEYRRRPKDNPVDYALFLRREARLFIEAKSLGARLDDGKWAAQLLNYATMAGVEWVALTDGDVWRIYNSHATVPVEKKLFRVVRVSDASTAPESTLSLLAKERLAGRIIDDIWKAEFVDRAVRDSLVRLLGPEPDAALLRRIKAATSSALTNAEIRASLGRLSISVEIPWVSADDSPRSSPSVPARERRPRATATAATRTREGTPWRSVTLAQLIESGHVRLPQGLEHHYRGHGLTARIEAVDRIVFDGHAYESLSTAGGMARKSVVGAPPGRDYPQTNGWTFWHYRRADGSLGVLDELRRQLHEGKVVRLDDARKQGA